MLRDPIGLCTIARSRMQFHLGKPILAMLILATISGTALRLRNPPTHDDLRLWVFDDSHARTYRDLSAGFQHQYDRSLEVDLIGNTAMNMRLTSLFLSGRGGELLPDATEIEIGGIGRYFRPPVDQVGFLPLNELLSHSGYRVIDSMRDPGQEGWNAQFRIDGIVYTYRHSRWAANPSRTHPDAWIDRIISARLAPWTKDGIIFGVPHDVHPVSLTYRDDLFREAGIDLSEAQSWAQFQEMCLAFQKYWAGRGYPLRHAMQLPPANSDYVTIMLQQRHVNVVDGEGRVHLADPIVAETIAFYAQLAGGKRAIGASSEGGVGAWINDLEIGNICCFWTPDWKCNEIREYGNSESLIGKLRMIPLPRFASEDAPTASWGGTMIGIPRRCSHPIQAWKLIEYLYFSDAGLDAQAQSHTLPALPEKWGNPFYHQPDPYFGGQKVDQLYVDLAARIPPRYVTPVTTIAQMEMSAVVSQAVDYVNHYGSAGLNGQVAKWLNWFDKDVKRRVEHATFDGP